jgi:hypothetical protein
MAPSQPCGPSLPMRPANDIPRMNAGSAEHPDLMGMIAEANAAQVHELGAMWNDLGSEIIDFGVSLQRTATSSESIWVGQAATAARTRLSELVTWCVLTGQGAQRMGTTVMRIQAEAVETAQRSMPAPVPYDPSEYQNRINSTSNPSNGCRSWGTPASRLHSTMRPSGSSKPTARPCSAPTERCPPSRRRRSSATGIPDRVPACRRLATVATDKATDKATAEQEVTPAAGAARRSPQAPAVVAPVAAARYPAAAAPTVVVIRPKAGRRRLHRGRWRRTFRAALAPVFHPEVGKVTWEPACRASRPPLRASAQPSWVGVDRVLAVEVAVPAGSSARAARAQ